MPENLHWRSKKLLKFLSDGKWYQHIPLREVGVNTVKQSLKAKVIKQRIIGRSPTGHFQVEFHITKLGRICLATERSKLSARYKKYKVGDILVHGTSYGEYCAEFFRITKLIGKKGLQLKRLESVIYETTGIAGFAIPDKKNENSSYPLLQGRIRKDGYVVYNDRYISNKIAQKWNGHPVHYQGTCYY